MAVNVISAIQAWTISALIIAVKNAPNKEEIGTEKTAIFLIVSKTSSNFNSNISNNTNNKAFRPHRHRASNPFLSALFW